MSEVEVVAAAGQVKAGPIPKGKVVGTEAGKVSERLPAHGGVVVAKSVAVERVGPADGVGVAGGVVVERVRTVAAM
jgi:hypothetical protein